MQQALTVIVDHFYTQGKDNVKILIIKNGWAGYTKDKHGNYVDVKIIFTEKHEGKTGTKTLSYEMQMMTKKMAILKHKKHDGYGKLRILPGLAESGVTSEPGSEPSSPA